LFSAAKFFGKFASAMDKTIEQLLKDLQGLRNEFNDFLYYLPDALLEVDLHSRRLTYMNRMANILFGYSEEDFSSGVAITQLFDEGEYDRAVAIITGYVAKSLEQKSEYVRSGRTELYEFTMRRKDGGVFPAETQTSFVLDRNHVPLALRTIVRDISDRKRAEASQTGKRPLLPAHEVQASLSEIIKNAETIFADAPPDSPIHVAARSIAQSARRTAEKLGLNLKTGL
jgi:PAS domain S-box-containing protein